MTTTPKRRGPGRPPGIHTPHNGAREARKNVSLDGDLVAEINAVCDALERGFGFRPTLSQAVRHMISKQGKS